MPCTGVGKGPAPHRAGRISKTLDEQEDNELALTVAKEYEGAIGNTLGPCQAFVAPTSQIVVRWMRRRKLNSRMGVSILLGDEKFMAAGYDAHACCG